MLNCTFSRNSASEAGGGIFNCDNSTLTNCMFIGNSARTNGGMYNCHAPTLTNCTFTNNCANDDGGGGSLGGTGNISSDPCFVDASNDDYHIRWSSNCINTGDPSFVFNINERDIDDEPSRPGREKIRTNSIRNPAPMGDTPRNISSWERYDN